MLNYISQEQYNKEDKLKKLVSTLFFDIVDIKGVSFLDNIFDANWNDNYKNILVCSIERGKSYWDWLETKKLSELYWSNVKWIYTESDIEYEAAIQQLDKFKNYRPMLDIVHQKLNESDMVKTSDIVKVLYGIANDKRLGNHVMYEIEELLDILQKRQDVNEQDLFGLEINYLRPFCENTDLKPITIDKYFRTKPNFFIEILKMVFGHENTAEKKSEKEKQRLENARKIATELYIRYEKVSPFNNENEFKLWLYSFMLLLKCPENKDLSKIAWRKIWEMLGNSPKDPQDNIWPIKYVRDIIENCSSDDLKRGIIYGKFNSIGARWIDNTNPGRDFLQWASEFRENAKKVRFSYPRTAEVLDDLAAAYEKFARQEEDICFSR